MTWSMGVEHDRLNTMSRPVARKARDISFTCSTSLGAQSYLRKSMPHSPHCAASCRAKEYLPRRLLGS